MFGVAWDTVYADIKTCIKDRILVLFKDAAGDAADKFTFAMTEPEVTATVLMAATKRTQPALMNVSNKIREANLAGTSLGSIMPVFAATDYKALYFAYKEFLAQPACYVVSGLDEEKKKNVPFFVACYGRCLHELVQQAIILQAATEDDAKHRSLALLTSEFVKAAAKSILAKPGEATKTPPWKGSASLGLGGLLQSCADNFTAATAVAKAFPGEEFAFLVEILDQLKVVLDTACGSLVESISKSIQDVGTYFTPIINSALGCINIPEELSHETLKKDKILKLTRDDSTKKILVMLPYLQDNLGKCRDFLPALHRIGSAIESQNVINFVVALQEDLKLLSNGATNAPPFHFTKYPDGQTLNIKDLCTFAGSVTLAQGLVREVGEKETRPGIVGQILKNLPKQRWTVCEQPLKKAQKAAKKS